MIGQLCLGADHHWLGGGVFAAEWRKGRWGENGRANRSEVAGRSKSNRVGFSAAGMFDPIPLRAVEGQLFTIHGKEILAEEFAQFGKQTAKPPDNGIVPPDRICCLETVDREDNNHNQHQCADDHPKHQGHGFQIPTHLNSPEYLVPHCHHHDGQYQGPRRLFTSQEVN